MLVIVCNLEQEDHAVQRSCHGRWPRKRVLDFLPRVNTIESRGVLMLMSEKKIWIGGLMDFVSKNEKVMGRLKKVFFSSLRRRKFQKSARRY